MAQAKKKKKEKPSKERPLEEQTIQKVVDYLNLQTGKNFKSRRKPKPTHEWWTRLIKEYPKHRYTITAHWEEAWKYYSRNQFYLH